MDTAGFLSRDLAELELFLTHSLPSLCSTSQQPLKRILYCNDFFPHDVPAQQELVDHFVAHLGSHIGATREDISIADCWAKNPPREDKEGRDIRKYLDKVGSSLTIKPYLLNQRVLTTSL